MVEINDNTKNRLKAAKQKGRNIVKDIKLKKQSKVVSNDNEKDNKEEMVVKEEKVEEKVEKTTKEEKKYIYLKINKAFSNFFIFGKRNNKIIKLINCEKLSFLDESDNIIVKITEEDYNLIENKLLQNNSEILPVNDEALLTFDKKSKFYTKGRIFIKNDISNDCFFYYKKGKEKEKINDFNQKIVTISSDDFTLKNNTCLRNFYIEYLSDYIFFLDNFDETLKLD